MRATGLKTRLRRSLKYRIYSPGRYFFNRIGGSLASSRPAVRLLLASDFDSYTSDQQFAPFTRYARELSNQVGLTSLVTDLAGARMLLSLAPKHFDVLALKMSFRTSAADASRTMREFRDLAPGLKLIYFDGDDDIAVQWPDVLANADLYVKKHAYSDRTQYGRKTVGKSNLTDYAHLAHGANFTADIIPENSPVPAEHRDRIVVGWNIALDDKIEKLRHELKPSPIFTRPVDIVCRATVNRDSWLYHLRKSVGPALDPLQRRFKVITPENRVPQDVYYQEMLSSKLCISPFGYGEICWRDFEAVLSGCVLVKPDMGHVETFPDIFVPHQTYIPVSWDYSDLAVQCERYLHMPEECQRISNSARAKLLDYYDRALFLESVTQILNRVGLPSSERDSTGTQ